RRAGLVVTGVALAVGALALNRQLIGVFYDDGLCAGIAIALARGIGYVHPHLPGAPAAVHYPPLWPVLLAPLFAVLPVDAAALLGKILNLLLAAAGAGLIAWHAARTRLLGEEAPPWLGPVAGAPPWWDRPRHGDELRQLLRDRAGGRTRRLLALPPRPASPLGQPHAELAPGALLLLCLRRGRARRRRLRHRVPAAPH